MSLSDATAFESTARGTDGEGAEAGEPTFSFPSGAHWYGKCGMCGKLFPNKRGASQHERLVHPEEYHRTRMHDLAKSGWPNDELVLVAREENRLVARARSLCGDQTYYPRVNQDLFRAFPGRSADAIRCLRKTARYKEVRDRLALGGSPVEDPIGYERPWETRPGPVEGGSPPPLEWQYRVGPGGRQSPWTGQVLSCVGRRGRWNC